MKSYGLGVVSHSLQRVARLSPIALQNREHDLVSPLTFDEFIFHKVRLLVKTGLFQRSHGGGVSSVASPHHAVKVVLLKGEFE